MNKYYLNCLTQTCSKITHLQNLPCFCRFIFFSKGTSHILNSIQANKYIVFEEVLLLTHQSSFCFKILFKPLSSDYAEGQKLSVKNVKQATQGFYKEPLETILFLDLSKDKADSFKACQKQDYLTFLCFQFKDQTSLIYSNNIIFQMESPSYKELKQDNHCKIYFTEKMFGKPTKNRKEDPSMFDLLSWGSDGFEKHSFKKDQKFKEPVEAYLNMIGKNSWTSQTQENYVSYHQNSIEANPQVLHKIQNYISQRQPESVKAERKSPQKNFKKGEKKLGLAQKDEKKQNKYQINNYLSPKAVSRKHIEVDNQDKFRRNSSGQRQKQGKKLKIKDEAKYENTHKQMVNKTFGQELERNKNQDKEFTQNQQQKLIQHFKQTTRWIPNSAFTTYFGKPPFENYGRGNTNPIDGGLVYGTYLYSHNVHPHRGQNQPKYIQSYPVALNKAKSHGTLVPSHPRTKPDFNADVAKTGGNQKDHKAKIQPEVNNFVGSLKIQAPKLTEIEKFGGKRGSRNVNEYHE